MIYSIYDMVVYHWEGELRVGCIVVVSSEVRAENEMEIHFTMDNGNQIPSTSVVEYVGNMKMVRERMIEKSNKAIDVLNDSTNREVRLSSIIEEWKEEDER